MPCSYHKWYLYFDMITSDNHVIPYIYTHTGAHNRFMALFPGARRRNLLDFMVQTKITEADAPTTWLAATPSWLISDPPPSSPIFSERELTFTFAICCRPSVCLSVICNVRAPYSGGSNFRQYFYSIMALDTLAIHWHALKILRRSSQGSPSAGGVKHKRGSKI